VRVKIIKVSSQYEMKQRKVFPRKKWSAGKKWSAFCACNSTRSYIALYTFFTQGEDEHSINIIIAGI
jgi:hypothetical protein